MLLTFGDDGLVPGADGGDLLAADSWLVLDGAVRGYDRHWRRFGGSGRFRDAVTAALPRDGAWFPRVERLAGGCRLRLRPAPERVPTARAWVVPEPDPRRAPLVKGPDLDVLGVLRERARAAGADEAILLDTGGDLVEGAYSSVLWWDGDALCTVPDGRALPGVTRALLLDRAAATGVPVCYDVVRPADLVEHETWLVSALHGVRPVTSWTFEDGVRTAAPAPRAAEWQAALLATAERLP